jgi:hypothetical protein
MPAAALVQEARAHRLALLVDQLDRALDELQRERVAPAALRRRRGTLQQRGAVRARELAGVGHRRPERQRAREVVGGLGGRVQPLGLGAGAHRRLQRARAVAGALPVVRELGRRRRGVRARRLRMALERVRERRVEARALAREQLAVGGLLQQRMAERVALVAGHEDVVPYGLAQRAGQSALGQLDRAGEQHVLHPPPAGCGGAHDLLRVRTQPAEAGEQHVSQPQRERVRVLAGRERRELLQEQRVAVGARADRVRPGGIRLRAEDPLELGARLGARQRRELDLLDDRHARDVGQERAQSLVAVELVAAVGHRDEQALALEPPQDERQQVERRAVGPVGVLDDEHNGRGRRQPPQQLVDRGVEALGGERGRLGDGRPRLRVGHQPRELRRRRAAVLAQAGERVGDRQQRNRRRLERDALPAEHERAEPFGARGELAHQARLAHARLAAQQHGPGASRGSALERALQAGQLGGAPCQDPALETPCHRASIAAGRSAGER